MAIMLGADEYLFALDTEEGVLLRAEARTFGAPFLLIEMIEIAFNVPFAADAFVIKPTGGPEQPAVPVSQARTHLGTFTDTRVP